MHTAASYYYTIHVVLYLSEIVPNVLYECVGWKAHKYEWSKRSLRLTTRDGGNQTIERSKGNN